MFSGLLSRSSFSAEFGHEVSGEVPDEFGCGEFLPVTSMVSFLCYEVHDKLSGELSGDFPVS